MSAADKSLPPAAERAAAGARHPILAVLVLYQVEAGNSLTLASFSRALAETGLLARFRLLLYDNSPLPAPVPETFPVPVTYIHDSANAGLVGAYNAALRMAEQEGSEWLLLLDQDTVVVADYLKTLCRTLEDVADDPRLAALVPKLLSKNALVSPTRVLWGWRLVPVEKNFTGIAPWEIAVLNSGTLVRISAVREVGGFNPLFWLDYLDHWLFNRLYRAGYLVYVLDAELAHELSLEDLCRMSVARYKNILLAEGQFYQSCKSAAENRFYLIKLLLRAAKMVVVPGRRRLFWPTLVHSARQLLPKSRRTWA